MLKSVGIAVLVLSLSGTAFAGGEKCKWLECLPKPPHGVIAPELDGASAAGALTLFAGGLAIFLGRRRSKASA